MPTPSRGAATNRPDTSNANVAALLRRGAIWLQTPAKADMTLEADMLALADALEQTGSKTAFQGALTQDEWVTRIERAARSTCEAVNGVGQWNSATQRYRNKMIDQTASLICAAFPELAPTDD